MKRYLLLLILLSINLFAHGQGFPAYRHTVFVTGGVSIPGSEFANATSIDVKDYVDRGVILGAGYKYAIFRYLAVGASVGYSENKLNEVAIEEASSTRINTVPWTSTFFTADLYALVPVRRFEAFLRGSVGVAFPNEWEFYAEQDASNGVLIKGTTNTADKSTVAYMTGIGLNYNANRIVIGIESNILAYKPEFEIDLNGSYGNRKEWIATLNQMLRVGFRF